MSVLGGQIGNPVVWRKGPNTKKRVYCPNATCKAARAVGAAAADDTATAHARAAGVNLVDAKRTGALICTECGTTFRMTGVI